MRCTLSDLPRINAILRHPDIYPHVSDDATLAPEKVNAKRRLENKRNVFLMPDKGCLFIFTELTHFCFIGHIHVLPEARGERAFAAAREAICWMFTRTRAIKLIGFTPHRNRQALLFVSALGFRREGLIKGGILIRDELQDLVVMGLDKIMWL